MCKITVQVMAEGGPSTNLSCSICFDEFKTPKILSCGHSFCRKCVWKLCSGKGWPSYQQCPKCRKKITIPESRKVDDFPTNFDLVDAISTQNLNRKRARKNSRGKLQDIDPACQCPTHKHRMDFYCKSCRKQICDNCLLKDHKPDKHTIVTASDVAENLLYELRILKELMQHHQAEEKSLGEHIRKGLNCYQQDQKRLEEEIRLTVQIEQEKLQKAAEDLLKELKTKVEGPAAKYADLQKQFTNLQALSNQSFERLNNLEEHFQKLHLSHSSDIPKICQSIDRLKDEKESLKTTCQWTQTKVGLNFIPNRPSTCKFGKLSKVSSKPTIIQPTNQLKYFTELVMSKLTVEEQ